MMATQSMVMVVMPIARVSVEMVSEKELSNVMMEAAIPILFLMHADSTAAFQDVEMVSVTLMNNVTLVPTLLNAKIVLSDVEMESWNLERSVTMASITQIQWPMVADPTAVLLIVVMESLMHLKSVMLELPTRIPQATAEPGALSPSVVMVLLTLQTRRLVMMEIPLMEMVVTLAANVSVEMAVLILESNVMLELETQILLLVAVVLLVPSQCVVMVSLTLVRSVTMEETTLLDPTPADLIVLHQNVVMALLTIFMEKSVTKVQETLGQPLMDVPQTVHQMSADKVLPSTQLSTLLTGFQNNPEFTTTRVLTLMLLLPRIGIGLSLQLLRQSLTVNWLSSERF